MYTFMYALAALADLAPPHQNTNFIENPAKKIL